MSQYKGVVHAHDNYEYGRSYSVEIITESGNNYNNNGGNSQLISDYIHTYGSICSNDNESYKKVWVISNNNPYDDPKKFVNISKLYKR